MSDLTNNIVYRITADGADRAAASIMRSVEAAKQAKQAGGWSPEQVELAKKSIANLQREAAGYDDLARSQLRTAGIQTSAWTPAVRQAESASASLGSQLRSLSLVATDGSDKMRVMAQAAARFAGFGEYAEKVGMLANKFQSLSGGIMTAVGALGAFAAGWKVGTWIRDATGLGKAIDDASGANTNTNGENNSADRISRQRQAFMQNWNQKNDGDMTGAGEAWRKISGRASTSIAWQQNAGAIRQAAAEKSPEQIVEDRLRLGQVKLPTDTAAAAAEYRRLVESERQRVETEKSAARSAADAERQRSEADASLLQDTEQTAYSAQWRREQRTAMDRQYAGRYTAGRAPQIYQAWRDREVEIRAGQSHTDAAGDRDPRIARAGRELAAALRLENWETTAKALADAAKDLADSAKQQAAESRRKALTAQREGLDLRRDTASDRLRMARAAGERASDSVQEDEDKLRNMGLSQDMFDLDFGRLIRDPRARQKRRRDLRDDEQFGEHLNSLAQGRRPRLSSRDWERFRDVSQAQNQRMEDLRHERKARQAAIDSSLTLDKVLKELKLLPHSA